MLKKYLASLAAAFARGDATEHTHRAALQTLLQDFAAGITATNEPKRIACGAPDFIISRGEIPLGFIETKDIGVLLDEAERSEQLQRYRAGLTNLILTDYLEFRWYVGGEKRLTARLAAVDHKGGLQADKAAAPAFERLLQGFFSVEQPTLNSPEELARRLAAQAQLLRRLIEQALTAEDEQGALHGVMLAFKSVLLHDLSQPDFADMYAQTICYGLFAARCNHTGGGFARKLAAYDLPKTNPFLQELFGQIAGPGLDERISWAVDDIAELLNRADIAAILQDFGSRSQREDPVVHFYETFLSAYDPTMREARGVYYTPQPVVDYIVRSLDLILQRDFGLSEGLADAGVINTAAGPTHQVQILDPATGTGTFLYAVIRHIAERFAGNQGLWSGYAARDLLPRLFGFELLMAPYTVAHMKLGLLLKETGFDLAGGRLQVILCNTLDEAAARQMALTGMERALTEEANRAHAVKRQAPVMVILGNPPYSGHSANTGEWLRHLLRGVDTQADGEKLKTANYFQYNQQDLGEKNPKWLNDDYVKFIRFAQWRIEQTGYGVLGFVTNHGYLDNPTFRGMRQSLMDCFDAIYLLDLHGNSKKKEQAPDGGKDENVFDIQQGVAIGLFVKYQVRRHTPARVYHADLFGSRAAKYAQLAELDAGKTQWATLSPAAPFHLFVPQDQTLRAEYEQGWKITEVMPVNSVGVVTARDSLCIHWSAEEAWHTVQDFAARPEEDARQRYRLGEDARDWQVKLAQQDLQDSGPKRDLLSPILYRPFDVRHTYYTGNSRGFICMPRTEVMRHMLAGENVGLITVRQQSISGTWCHVGVADQIMESCAVSNKTAEINYLFPLYLYPGGKQEKWKANAIQTQHPSGRLINLSKTFIAALEGAVSLRFDADAAGAPERFGAEDVLHYAYAVFYSPSYRRRYAAFLKIDFPRLPLPTDAEEFRRLSALGRELVDLHLMRHRPKPECSYPLAGDNRVDVVRYSEPKDDAPGRVWINATQYFDPVPPAVWGYAIGGYQVCQKWLKDRKGRALDYAELTHYQGIVAALAATIALQDEIERVYAPSPPAPLP